jgi:lantibiotic modifying enzyme
LTPIGLTPARALNLAERRDALPDTWLAGELPPAAAQEATERLEWWEQVYLAGSKRLLARRLRALRCDCHTVLPLLAVGPQSKIQNPKSKIPPWQVILAEVLARHASGQATAANAAAPGFESAFTPFLRWAQARLEERLAPLQGAAHGWDLDGAALAAQFGENLRSRLNGQASRAFVLRMHAAKLTSRLRAETPEARFAEFVRSELADPEGFAALLEEYPVLGRILATSAQAAVEAWGEALQRLLADQEAIRRAFARPSRPDTLVALEAGLGDPHRGGRSVMKLRFASGWRLVYKPKPLAVDVHFQDLLAWLHDKGLDPPLRTLTVLDRGDYGWMEFVEAGPCTDRAQVEAFYRRQGALLLVLYLLDATDFHLENVIAAGEHPVAIDLEMLFHNQARPPARPTPETAAKSVFSQLVLATGLLPMRRVGPAGTVELSGLAGEGGQTSPFVAPRWQGENTDAMRLITQQTALPASENMPRLGDQPARVGDYTRALIRGFEEAYRLVLAQREALAAPGGPLRAFRGDRVRHLLRATREYAALLADSHHPSCLRDAVERDFLFDTLWQSVPALPHLAATVPSEREDLWDGDIPVFTAQVNSRDLFDSRGCPLKGFFLTTGLERVLRRLERFGEDDLALQLYCIHGSLATVAPTSTSRESRVAGREKAEGRRQKAEGSPDGASAVPAAFRSSGLPSAFCLLPSAFSRPVTRDPRLTVAAVRIGERLAQLAVIESGEAHWVGPEILPDRCSMFLPLAADLYAGVAGIALFLAYLGRTTGRDDFDALARAAYGSVRRRLQAPEEGAAIGAFFGIPSMLYAALHLAVLWREPAVLVEALPALRTIRRNVPRDRSFDLMRGAAGCLAVMLRLHRHLAPARDPRLTAAAFEIAQACGQHLLHHALPIDGGIAWPPIIGAYPLLGFSHGTAGIAWALFELAAATGEECYWEAATSALVYERAYFDPQAGNWPDFRHLPDGTSGAGASRFPWAWCHGAPGIGLARLLSRRHAGDAAMADEIEAALHGTAAHGFGLSHCLCHGDLGNLELFLCAARELEEPRWQRLASQHAQALLEDVPPNGGWRCGDTGFPEVPGLMTGLAGIGYGLLRLADPDRVPSLLTLEGPHADTE